MKKLFIILLMISMLLASCSANSIPIDYDVVSLIEVYAFNISDEKIQKIQIDYEIRNPRDIFYLYTINQNSLPIGYNSCCYTNVSLLDYKEDDNSIIYSVDSYVKLIDNFYIFQKILYDTNMLLFDKSTIIIHNNAIYTKNDKK